MILDDAGGATPRWADAAANAFDRSVDVTSRLIPVDDVLVTFKSDPGATIPEWGVGGYTHDAHHIYVAMDPFAKHCGEFIVRTLVHEFHHAVRWRSTSLALEELDLRDMLASEGLAVLFEEEVLGTAPFFATPEPATSDVALALRALDDRPCNASEWFYGAGRVPFGFGYALGYRLCRDYSSRRHTSPSALIAAPSGEIINP